MRLLRLFFTYVSLAAARHPAGAESAVHVKDSLMLFMKTQTGSITRIAIGSQRCAGSRLARKHGLAASVFQIKRILGIVAATKCTGVASETMGVLPFWLVCLGYRPRLPRSSNSLTDFPFCRLLHGLSVQLSCLFSPHLLEGTRCRVWYFVPVRQP